MKKINAFTMPIDAPDSVLVSVLQCGVEVTSTARLRASDGTLVKDLDIAPVFGDNPFAVLLEMLENVKVLTARNCGLFIKSDALTDWFLVKRMRCRLRKSGEKTRRKFEYTRGSWLIEEPKRSTDPRWSIPLLLFSYSQVGLWRARELKSTAQFHVDNYGKMC